MALDWETNSTYWYVDKQNNMLINNNVITPIDEGKYDAIEKALHAYIAYEDSRFINGIESCWTWQNGKFIGKRYPEFKFNDIGISRDHTIYSFVAWKLSKMNNNHLYLRAKALPFMLGNEIGLTMTPSLWLWLRLISGKKIGLLWYPSILVANFIKNIWNKLISFLFNFSLKETPQENFVKGKKNWKDKLLVPTFELKLRAFQLFVLPNSWFKRVIQKVCLWNTPSENILLKLMFGSKKVTQEQVDNYKSMCGDRWSDELNPERTRGGYLYIDTNEEFLKANVQDKDLLLKIWDYSKR